MHGGLGAGGDTRRQPGALSAGCPETARGAELGARAKLPPFDPPRTPEGTPNLQGRWGGPSGGDDIEEHDYVDVSSPPEETYLSDPPGGKVPYQPWALEVAGAASSGAGARMAGGKGAAVPDPQTFCLYSVPRATYRGGFEIVQRPWLRDDIVRLQPLLSLHSHRRPSA